MQTDIRVPLQARHERRFASGACRVRQKIGVSDSSGLLCIVGNVNRPSAGVPKMSLELVEMAAYSPWNRSSMITSMRGAIL